MDEKWAGKFKSLKPQSRLVWISLAVNQRPFNLSFKPVIVTFSYLSFKTSVGQPVCGIILNKSWPHRRWSILKVDTNPQPKPLSKSLQRHGCTNDNAVVHILYLTGSWLAWVQLHPQIFRGTNFVPTDFQKDWLCTYRFFTIFRL